MVHAELPETTGGPLRRLARKYRGRLLAEYGLLGLESLAELALPLTLGLAVNGLLKGSVTGLLIFAAQQLVALGLGVVRRLYGVRFFTRVASELVERLVLEQRTAGVALSQVSARAALSRQLVDFFERDLPFLFHCGLQGLGALVMLAVATPPLLPYCLGAVVLAGAFGLVYARYSRRWNQNWHDELERSVGVIDSGTEADVRRHYRRLAGWQVRIADGATLYFGSWQGLALVLTGAVLFQCGSIGASAGQVTTVLGYVQMLLTTLVNTPQIIDQVTRLCDTCRRITCRGDGDSAPTAGEDCLSGAESKTLVLS